jgi:hypothetical protein
MRTTHNNHCECSQPLPLRFLMPEPGATSLLATWQPNHNDLCRSSPRPLTSRERPMRTIHNDHRESSQPLPLRFLMPEPGATSLLATWQPNVVIQSRAPTCTSRAPTPMTHCEPSQALPLRFLTRELATSSFILASTCITRAP